MSLVVNTNTASLGAQRYLSDTQRALSTNLAHLASGSRITSASDDAAGLGVSAKLQAQIKSLDQASRNANDGISMIQVADGAMNEQAGILNRLRELAVQSSNGTLGSTERGFIDTEAQQLSDELDRISSVTDFNGTKMLGADAGAVTMQIGANNTANDRIDIAFGKTDTTTLAVQYGAGKDVDLGTSAATAQASIDKIDSAISALSTDRATVGAAQSRLEVTVDNLATANENLSAANSRISDVDIASETAAMTRNQILSQAGISVLAQANALPQQALTLLQK